jgi:hypothetical protein
MLKDVVAQLCYDCDEVAFVWDNDGHIEINHCACVDGMSDLDWVNE